MLEEVSREVVGVIQMKLDCGPLVFFVQTICYNYYKHLDTFLIFECCNHAYDIYTLIYIYIYILIFIHLSQIIIFIYIYIYIYIYTYIYIHIYIYIHVDRTYNYVIMCVHLYVSMLTPFSACDVVGWTQQGLSPRQKGLL